MRKIICSTVAASLGIGVFIATRALMEGTKTSKRVEAFEVRDIRGLVDASTAAGTYVDGTRWTLVFHLAGWKDRENGLQRESLRVEMPVADRDELARYMDEISPYDVVHLRG